MEYKIRETVLPVYYSTMSGLTQYPYSFLHGSQMDEHPIKRLHYHPVPEIGICVSGSGYYYVGEKIYRFKKGDIQIIRQFVPHYAVSDANTITRMKFFTFDISKLMQHIGLSDPEIALLMKNVKIPFNEIFKQEEYPDIAENINKIIQRCETNDDYTDISVAFGILEFLILCRKYGEKLNTLPEEQLLEEQYNRIAPAIQQINLNLEDSSKITESELARVCNMCVSNFRRIFKIETGLSPKSFIIKSRISYAKYLLKNTNMTITEISEKLGYNAVCGFNKIFLSTFKISPSQYRKQYK